MCGLGLVSSLVRSQYIRSALTVCYAGKHVLIGCGKKVALEIIAAELQAVLRCYTRPLCSCACIVSTDVVMFAQDTCGSLLCTAVQVHDIQASGNAPTVLG